MAKLHDQLTKIGYFFACLALFAILVIMNGEIVARYALNLPTKWSADIVAYLILAVVALGMPEIARTRGHIATTLFGERMSDSQKRFADLARNLVMLLVVAAVSYLIIVTAISEYQSGVRTVAVFAIPKWYLNASLAYGFASSSLHVFRHVMRPTASTQESVAEGAID